MMTVLAGARRGVGNDTTGRRSIDGHWQVKRLFNFLDRGSVYWLPLAFMFIAALARLAVPDVLDRLSLIWFDMCQRAQPRTASEVPVRIIDIDDKSLKQFGQWPWPRSLVAELVDKLSEAGAAVITFDVLFAERDRTSPQSLISLLSQAGVSGDEAQRLLSTMVDPD
jgi:adenylate cyclase